MPRISPRTLLPAAVVTVLLLVSAVVVVLRTSCDNSQATRHDQRAMWVYLLEQNPDPGDPRAISFHAELDRRIPELSCSWAGTPNPQEDP